ncbi:hypothetical protein WAI453_000602 [Rhynchosporium graminicola]
MSLRRQSGVVGSIDIDWKVDGPSISIRGSWTFRPAAALHLLLPDFSSVASNHRDNAFVLLLERDSITIQQI